jgi:tubulin polyglutamylase TTLL9
LQEEFRRQGDKAMWIIKPAGRSQGKGIFLANKISALQQLEPRDSEPHIVQQYIS